MFLHSSLNNKHPLLWHYLSWNYSRYTVQLLSCADDKLFTPVLRETLARAFPFAEIYPALQQIVCAATAHKQSPRSKSNTPIPLYGTTKVFPAATWYSVRRSCVKMPRPTAG